MQTFKPRPDRFFQAAALAFLMLCGAADGRTLSSKVSITDQIPVMRPEYPVPDDSNLLFYVERSVNSNTVVYAANLDAHGAVDAKAPVIAFWRWFNVDGHKKDLNFVERVMAYGVDVDARKPGQPITFKIAALPERTLTLGKDAAGKPEALIEIGGHAVKLAYVYLHVVDGLVPSVSAIEIFGTDKVTGKAVQEHIVQS